MRTRNRPVGLVAALLLVGTLPTGWVTAGFGETTSDAASNAASNDANNDAGDVAEDAERPSSA